MKNINKNKNLCTKNIKNCTKFIKNKQDLEYKNLQFHENQQYKQDFRFKNMH